MGKGIRLTSVLVLLALFLGGAASADDPVFYPEDTYDASGVPQNRHMLWSAPGNPFIPSQDLADRINASLVEKKDIRTFNPAAIASDNQSNILLADNAQVYITLLHDGAGYRNSFGYFTYVEGSPPGSAALIRHNLVFPNASCQGSGGGLHLGDTVQIGGSGHTYAAGTRIGFFVASDAWSGNPSDPVNVNAKGLHYSLRGLNAETDPGLQAHFVLLYEEDAGGGKEIILGAEDINRSLAGCDHDFNDVIFLVTADPDDAIDTGTMGVDEVVTSTADTDGDGVLDENDEFPGDITRAFYSHSPSALTMGTIAYEDLWPLRGDFDFNDLVVWYNFRNVINAMGNVKDVVGTFEIAAVGAGYNNGFALLLPFPVQAIESATLRVKEAGETVYTIDPSFAVEDSNGSALAVLFDDAWQHITPPAGALFANTESGTERVEGASFRLEITLVDATMPASSPPYNPFLFRTGERGIEIHLIDEAPSVHADTQLFGTGDDRSIPGQSSYYKTDNGLPWAIHVPVRWSHPSEKTDIVRAYPLIVDWAQSGGTSNTDWYLPENAESGHIYAP